MQLKYQAAMVCRIAGLQHTLPQSERGRHLLHESHVRECVYADATSHRCLQIEIMTAEADLEARPMVTRPGVKLLAQQDILLGDVGVDQEDLGGVKRISEDALRHLEHGRDARASRNHACMSAGTALAHPLPGAHVHVWLHGPEEDNRTKKLPQAATKAGTETIANIPAPPSNVTGGCFHLGA